jgi:hypothetical protein
LNIDEQMAEVAIKSFIREILDRLDRAAAVAKAAHARQMPATSTRQSRSRSISNSLCMKRTQYLNAAGLINCVGRR